MTFTYDIHEQGTQICLHHMLCGLSPLNGHSVVVFRTLDGVCVGIYSHILKDFLTDHKYCGGGPLTYCDLLGKVYLIN